jgi:hypothetical protein
MSKVADGTKVLLNSAQLYFDRFNSSGASTGLLFLGNCTSFELSGSVETKEIYDSSSKERGLLASVDIRTNPEVTLKMTEFEKYKIAIALKGTALDLTQSSGAVANEAAVAYKDRYIQLAGYASAAKPISAVTVTGTGGTPTYSGTTDYEVDLNNARIYIIPGGTIADGTVLEIDYTKATLVAADIPKVSVFDNTVLGRMQAIGDPLNGPKLRVDLWRVKMSPDGAFPIIGDDFAEFAIRGKVLSDKVNHATEPYGQILVIG